MLVDKGVKNMQRKMQDQQRQRQKPSRPGGEVTIEDTRNNATFKSKPWINMSI